MPGVFNDDFIPYINQIITPILKVSFLKIKQFYQQISLLLKLMDILIISVFFFDVKSHYFYINIFKNI